LDFISLPSLRNGRAVLGTIIGGGDQAAARVACEFGVNLRHHRPAHPPDSGSGCPQVLAADWS
jgi:hypothetical protein